MNPSIAVRSAAYAALAAALALDPDNPDYAPLNGAKAWFGATFPTQSASPGAAAFPNQLLIYGWEAKSESVSGKQTAPQFETVLTLVIEARVEVKASAQLAANAVLPAAADQDAIDNAIDGALDALTFAVKKAICGHIQRVAPLFNGGQPWIEQIKTVEIANKYEPDGGQRIAGNGACSFDIVFGEYFDPPLGVPLSDVAILVSPQAGGVANEGNRGNGTISPVAVLLGAAPGPIAVSFTSATAFTVTPQQGAPVSGTVGEAFSGAGVSFTIAAGTLAFAAGDGFTVTVQAGADSQINLSS